MGCIAHRELPGATHVRQAERHLVPTEVLPGQADEDLNQFRTEAWVLTNLEGALQVGQPFVMLSMTLYERCKRRSA
jgi:hypothetical protein